MKNYAHLHSHHKGYTVVKLCNSTVLSVKRGSISEEFTGFRVWGLTHSKRPNASLALKEEVGKQNARRQNDRK